MENTCTKCGGFVGEPMKAYGYAGKWCHCVEPSKLTPTNQTFIQVCTCGQKCPVHGEQTPSTLTTQH